jgi:hypothetical protein
MQQVQDFAGDVFTRLGVLNNDPFASDKHVVQINKRHIGHGLRIVETTTAISFDQDFLAHAGRVMHKSKPPMHDPGVEAAKRTRKSGGRRRSIPSPNISASLNLRFWCIAANRACR